MDGIRPGEICVITHDIGTAFRQGEQVVVQQVDPDPQAPQYMYLVQSSTDMNWYKLSDQDLILQQQPASAEQQIAQPAVGAPSAKRGTNWKMLGLTLLIVILLGAGGIAALYFFVWNNSSNDDTVNEKPVIIESPQSTSPSTLPSNAQSAYGTVKVTKALFDQVQNGMSYSQVVGIFGGPGEVKSEAGTPGQPGYQIEYAWDGDKPGSTVFCTFIEDKLSNKVNSGL